MFIKKGFNMNKMSISKEDTLVMKLIHYFVTNEDYRPIVVHGVQNEIWLENLKTADIIQNRQSWNLKIILLII